MAQWCVLLAGVRAKNEDTYFVSDDVAAGVYSSSAPGDVAATSKFQKVTAFMLMGLRAQMAPGLEPQAAAVEFGHSIILRALWKALLVIRLVL